MGRLAQSFDDAGISVLAIGPSDVATATRIQQTFQSPFQVLGDEGREAFKAFGLTKFAGVIQRSGTVLIERTGIIRHMNRGSNPQTSLRLQALLEAVEQLTGHHIDDPS